MHRSGRGPRLPQATDPIRDPDGLILAELFSADRLERHGESLAAAQRITPGTERGRAIRPRVLENGATLLRAYRALSRAIDEERTISPAAEWLVDNFHIVDEQVREIRDHLPRAYYRQLPKLADGHLEQYPRVFSIAWAYLAHTDSSFDGETLGRFVAAYQRVQPLTLGELWAIPISLRVLLLENLRRVADELVASRAARQRADDFADRMAESSGRGDGNALIRALEEVPLSTAGQVQLVQRLRNQDPAANPAIAWLEEVLAREGLTAESTILAEQQHQAVLNLTTRNVISSMRQISWFDWPRFVESVSLVDEILRERSTFAELDFPTRDRYRHAIEQLARRSGRAEVEVARQVVERAGSDPGPGGPDPPAWSDPGYHLIAEGRYAFERELGARAGFGARLRRVYVANAVPGYLVTLVVATGAILMVPLLISQAAGLTEAGVIIVALLAIIPASDVAITLVNRYVTAVLEPRPLPRLELHGGPPTALRTLVVMPTMLIPDSDIEAQVERLVVHYLANPEGDVRFALVSDWADAPDELVERDQALVDRARAAARRLNARYGEAPGGGARFLVLHRGRRWNPGEGCWMGWERKRGKLRELNALLRGSDDTSFLQPAGPETTPPGGVRYVVTLDDDSRLPAGAVRELVGSIAHPLNRARHGPDGRVLAGYGILQPRITPMLPLETDASVMQRVYATSAGIDPYARAVSDVYQDAFHEGTYVGKGIYEVDAFERALAGRIRENTLLSHDLFEGSFARCALTSEIELFDEAPSTYLEAAARQHRWVRGDWQLLPWILGTARDVSGRRDGRAITAIDRWKMIDNLRRSLSAPSAVTGLLVAWTLAPGVGGIWTLLILLSIAIPVLLPFLEALLPRRRGIGKRSHVAGILDELGVATVHIAVAIVTLAHQAALMVDAIGRTLVRLVTRRHLLQWRSTARIRAEGGHGVLVHYRRMAGGVGIGVAAGLLVGALNPAAAWLAGPFAAAWLGSPLIAWWAGSTPSPSRRRPTQVDALQLRRAARRTWRFFERFVGPEEHWLPPDNFQEDPEPTVAHRTSPTNIGLCLLASITARDLGWIGVAEMADRLESTLATLDRLERYRGHLLNWYDTRTLNALEPAYVSTVDSGNLCSHLLTLAVACREAAAPLPDARASGASPAAAALPGLEDEVLLALESLDRLRPVLRQSSDGAAPAATLQALSGHVREMPDGGMPWAERLSGVLALAERLQGEVASLVDGQGDPAAAELAFWAAAIGASAESHRRDLEAGRVAGLPRRLERIAARAEELVARTDFSFLSDPARRHLLSIGFRVRDGVLDPGHYDLLASEARLASYLAIAKGDVDVSHWFRLGRALVPVGRGLALISWSGSMFEYLMPNLVMRPPIRSLLAETCRLVVARQVQYGRERGVPWGVSESAYFARDQNMTYQYSAFGVPGLGIKRGLGHELVIAPYATALGAMVDPAAAGRNLERLEAAGVLGPYGYREALDYTAQRLPEGVRVAVVGAYMAHHQGMTLVALGNVLTGDAMARRFHRDPTVQSCELLLQERMPRDVLVARPRATEIRGPADVREPVAPILRRFTSPHGRLPRTQLLSNGHYTVMITSAGSGFSRLGNTAVTRWREDITRDDLGTFVFLRETRSGRIWSAGYQPSGSEPDDYEVRFAEDRAEILRRDGSIATRLSVVVSAEHDAEIRQLTLTNLGARHREVEVTSYAEIALASQAADLAHPALQKLFVRTEFDAATGALLAGRRPRSADDPPVWAAHLCAVDAGVGVLQYETDRARFIGRGRTIRNPAAMDQGHLLSNTVGAVLDPIFSLRRRVALPPGASVRVLLSTLVADSREQLLELADEYHDVGAGERAATLAWTQSQVQLHHLRLEPAEAQLFQSLANRIIYRDRGLQLPSEQLERNRLGVAALWAHGISGDLPLVLAEVATEDDLGLVRELLRAREYWRARQLFVDLVLVNQEGVSYAPGLGEALEALVRTGRPAAMGDADAASGQVHLLRDDQLDAQTRLLLRAAARVVLGSGLGNLQQQLSRLERAEADVPPVHGAEGPSLEHEPLPGPDLERFNGLGGFAADGREYVTVLAPARQTPAPWLNVIANGDFGFQVSESGSGYTWSVNSRENQLTPWSNDPVTDPPGEAIYLRDEETGELWGPTPLPIRIPSSTYIVCHGPGYSRFETEHRGIRTGLTQFVMLDAPLKVSVLEIQNRSGRDRRLSVCAYAQWQLGAVGASRSLVATELEPETRALLARNPWNAEFAGRVAFLDLGGRQADWTTDRTEFLGRNGDLAHPAALAPGRRLSGTASTAADPCAALRAEITLESGGRTRLLVLLGQGEGRLATARMVRRGRALDPDAALAAVQEHWRGILDAVQVRTPDRSMDLLLNTWLPYQTIACRLLARSAFFQAGGAFGFRDQLQDSMAVVVSQPALARDQILRAAAHQFPEGDVLHWWHPPSGRGVRTRISDDRLWLPFVVAHYVSATGDSAVLDQEIPFVSGAVLEPDQHDHYFEPARGPDGASLFEHCARAIDCSLETGAHGLPLIGTGDWNDAMDRIGVEGRGESIWLGWFLCAVLDRFSPIAERRGEVTRARAWRAHLAVTRKALERDGWDGDWYRRAYFDSGRPVGSASQEECRIDAIAQSWSVLSRAGNRARSARAMAAVDEHLVRRSEGLVLLFTPPFDQIPEDPGYIKGYPPGVRENGGQYTHGAAWTVAAFAELGDGDAAAGLFALINPVNLAGSGAGVHRYGGEPYVMAADVYSEPGHVGRAGWTWYTGSAGWMYRVGLEWILGIRLAGRHLIVDPCIPPSWPGFEVTLRRGSARYEISVTNPHGVSRGIRRVDLDGRTLAGRRGRVPLVDDGELHRVAVTMG